MDRRSRQVDRRSRRQARKTKSRALRAPKARHIPKTKTKSCALQASIDPEAVQPYRHLRQPPVRLRDLVSFRLPLHEVGHYREVMSSRSTRRFRRTSSRSRNAGVKLGGAVEAAWGRRHRSRSRALSPPCGHAIVLRLRRWSRRSLTTIWATTI